MVTSSYPLAPAPADLTTSFPLLEAADHLPKRNGRKIHKATLYRWAKSGRLKVFELGGSLYTTHQFIDEFAGKGSQKSESAKRLRIANKEADRLGLV